MWRIKATRYAPKQQGYILLAMLLVMTLAIIAATAAAPSIAFQLKRDREEELVHRGVQYSRAIRRYAKKTGRYPLSLQDLLGDGNVRYIRKLYKDPITGKDFRMLHQSDIQSFAPVNVNNSGSQANGNHDLPRDGQAVAASDQNASTDSTTDSTVDAGSTQPNGQLIFGVASRSHARTIREFNRKNHYHQWLFYYDVRSDQGREIKGPTPLFSPQSLQSPPPAPDAAANGQSPADGSQPQANEPNPQ